MPQSFLYFSICAATKKLIGNTYGIINDEQLMEQADAPAKSGYGKYLRQIAAATLENLVRLSPPPKPIRNS